MKRRNWAWLRRAIDHQLRNGYTTAELSEFYSVSRQRMWQVLRKQGLIPPAVRRKRSLTLTGVGKGPK